MRVKADQRLTEFITILRDADFDASWENVLDALWLASLGRKLDLGGASSAIKPGGAALRDGPGSHSGPSFSQKADARKNRERGRQREERANDKTDGDEARAHAGLYAHGDVTSEDRTVTASPILLPAARTLPDRLAVARALRPFRQRRQSDVRLELDEARTAELTAELRLVLGEGLFAALRPQQERWYEAHLVLEDEPAVEVWGAPLREFTDLLRQTGAFRLVRIWRLRLDQAKPRDPQKARLETPAGALISPRILAGDERRLVLFASHGDSLHWVDGTYASLLKSWSAASLVLLHLLPRHRWTYTLLGEPQALARASRPGSAAEALDVETFWWRLSPDPSQPRILRLPAVPIVPQALRAWSRMQMGLGQGSEAFLIDPAEALTDTELAKLLPEKLEPARALTNLRERSVAAFDLAVMLASAPFTLPVARLVQEVTQGGRTDFSVLAELMLSGVVVACGSEEASRRTSETTYFEISGAVRPHLLRSLRNADAVALAVALDQRVSAHLSAIAGRNLQFSALLVDEQGDTRLPVWARAFAHLTTALQGRRKPLSDWSLQEALEVLDQLSRPLLGQLARLAATDASFAADNVRPDLWPLVKDPRFVAATPIGLKFRPAVAAYLADRLNEKPFLGLRLLWVDDNPSNTAGPAAMLEQGGAEPIQYALTTEQALQHPALDQFDVILSDMTRNDDHDAGYELLRELRASGLTTPLIFAASTMNTEELRARAVAAGAFGGTNGTDTLLQLIKQAARSATLPRKTDASTSKTRVDDEAQAAKGIKAPPASPRTSTPLRDAAILWVDDRPDNNVTERAFLARSGVFVTLALSTNDALQAISEHRFDAIISDLGRPEGNRAGLDLLRRVRQRSNLPFAIYAGARGVQLAEEAKRLGATISTDHFESITEALSDALGSGVSHAMLSETQSARLRELLKLYDTASWPDQHGLIGAADHWVSVWQTMEPYDRIAALAVAVVDAVANTGYCQLFRVRNDRIVLTASRIATPKAEYSEASWEGVIGRAARTGTTIHLPDVTEDPGYIPAESSTRSELAIPIIGINGRAIGVINIESPRLSAFSGHQSQWLMAFAATLIDYLSGEASSSPSRSTRSTNSAHESPMIDGGGLSEGRGDIARLVAEEPDLDKLFKGLMAIVKPFVDFDEANVSILSSDQEHSRVICVLGAPKRHTARRLRMSPEFVNWIKQPQTWVADFGDVLSAAPQMLDAPDATAAIDAGYRALIALPVHQGSETRGWLCLLSRKPGIYNSETLRTLQQLVPNEALGAVIYAAERAENLFVANLLKKMEASSLLDAAQTAVKDIGDFYSFENTSIFRVDESLGRFELLAQAAFDGAFVVKHGYTQRLDLGLLGLAYRRGEPVILDDVDDDSEDAKHYVRVASEVRSVLCNPIRQFGRIVWILSVEDRRRAAFTPMDVETLQRIIQQMEMALERRENSTYVADVHEALHHATQPRVSDQPERREYLISGRVQGVGFRAFVKKQLAALGLAGIAENLSDGRIRVIVTGPAVQLDQLEPRLRQGPPASRIDDVFVQRDDNVGAPESSRATPTPQRPAPPHGNRRAVIAIGVDRVASLPTLRAAASGARQFARWSRENQKIPSERVWLFTDEDKPVGVNEIRKAVTTCVLGGDLDQIIVYFSGHGTNIAQQDLWLLSDASQDLNEAVGVEQNVQLARYSGIPHVVFISDTSRTAEAGAKALVSPMGSLIFPNVPEHRTTSVRCVVDRFFAARVAQLAYEVEGESVFTSVLLSALSGNESSVLTEHDGRQVVTSRSLSRLLRQAVPERLAQVAVSLHQAPDTIIESGDDSWLAAFES